MSDDRERPRPPGAYTIDERRVAAHSQADAQRLPRALPDLARIELDAIDAIEREEVAEAAVLPVRRKGFPFAKLFLGALGALLSIAVGAAIDDLVRDLFARADWLGWTALGLAALLAAGLIGVVARELAGLARLKAVGADRKAAMRAYELDSQAEAEAVVADLVSLLSDRPETAAGRARLDALRGDVIDGRDMIALAEGELLAPLDRNARALVLLSAKRVSVVTAVSPKAIVDISYVLFENLRLIRRMSELYGARPGTIGLVKLTRDVIGHLALTGTISIGDNIVGQVVGHGLAARLSARLGEGVVNGLLTARVGIAAMDLCRPMPFIRAKRPRIGDFMGDLLRLQGDAEKSQAPRQPPADRA